MTIINTLPFDLQNGTTADASQVMADFDGIVDDVNNNAAHNGANNDITSLSALTTPLTPAQGGTTNYIGGTSAGTANAQTVSTTPTGFALTNGYRVTFIAGFTNTGPMTLTVNATTTKNVFRMTPGGPEALTGGEVVLGNVVEAIYDGTQFELITTQNQFGGFGAPVTVASATTVDLGAIPAHYIFITTPGTAITSFGSSASTTYPIYFVSLNSGITLTHSVSLILPGTTDIVTNAGDFAIFVYVGSGNWTCLSYQRRNGRALQFNPAFIPGYINNLTLSTAGGSATFGIFAGVAVDSTGTGAVMTLATSYTKTTSSWALGTGNGGLDTGAIATSTWYHVYLIERVDTGVTDIIFSLSASAPTLPTNYTLYRRIGSMKTDGSSHWILFTQIGDQFIWSVMVTDLNAGTSATRATTTLTVPTGVVVTALFRATGNSGATAGGVLLTSLFESDQAPGGASNGPSDLVGIANSVVSGSFARLTNTSAQIGYRNGSTLTSTSIFTYGWIDDRGKT